ncbi:hypothetical protein F383_28825 [Gossypium arboreum]|uniref:Uncharacterized protein n=1 Tax=Gossypium arboreum TaxID=29729 RepID=A0A0B0MZA0_GOSAR|nr:hypothetical protein F383_28825 [Gossypium arboreum]
MGSICCCSSTFQKPLEFLVFSHYWAPLGRLLIGCNGFCWARD